MDHLHYLVFLGAMLVVLSIFAGLVSSRFGAPLLLVFLALGMLAGEEGPGGIVFDDFELTYLVGSIALAVILFDGGLRTKRESFELAARPALTLATIGVLLTAALLGLAAHLLLGFEPVQSFLIGSIVASTDAAAVFFLLNVRGMELQKRVTATLEVESGINDPMAVFLTVTCVELLRLGTTLSGFELAMQFVLQMLGGLAIGLAGGLLLVWLINRLDLASGLYPIFAVAVALALFGGAQVLHSSGFLAVYMAGMVLGNKRHRASQLISRFHDGLAWLSQIIMFLVLGLLVTPSQLLPDLVPALVVAFTLLLIARPIAVWLCLLPFRFHRREVAFVAWVGLRGAVPIFLATMPVLAGLPQSSVYFTVAFVVVIASLAIQGWTIAPAARALNLELPPVPEGAERRDLDVVSGMDRDFAGYRVAAGSPALEPAFADLRLPRRTRVLAVIRDGTVMDRTRLPRLEADDYILAVAPPEQMMQLDRLFAARPVEANGQVFGEFVLDADVPLGTVSEFYGFAVKQHERHHTLGSFILQRLKHRAVVGDRIRVGDVELVVRELERNEIKSVGIELAPTRNPLRRLRLARRLVHRQTSR